MRNTTYRTIIILCLVFANSFMSEAQTYVYDAFIRGHNVGKMTVVREINDESEKISVISHVEAHMIVRIRVDFESSSTYMNGAIVEATSITKTNGKVHSETNTILKDGKYQATIDGDIKKISDSKLVGGDMFYFEEPTNIKKVYALATGQMLDVVAEGANDYYFEYDGKKELHKYLNGVLHELRLEHKLYTVVFKLKK